MKTIQITRQGMFETNSSSTHAIVLDRNGEGLMETLIPNWAQDSLIVPIYWETDGTLSTAFDKLTYLTTFAFWVEKKPEWQGLIAGLVKEQTGLNLIITVPECGGSHNYYETPTVTWDNYIDYGGDPDGFGHDRAQDIFYKGKEALRQVIFNKDFKIHVYD